MIIFYEDLCLKQDIVNTSSQSIMSTTFFSSLFHELSLFDEIFFEINSSNMFNYDEISRAFRIFYMATKKEI